MVSSVGSPPLTAVAGHAVQRSAVEGSSVLLSLQYARAVAALLVVYAHLSGFPLFRPLNLPEFGGIGVDLFFVISGFVMWESAQKHGPAQFALRRVIRIVPAYWFYTSVLVVIALAAPSLTPNVSFDRWTLVGSYFFIPYTNAQGLQNPILLQGWTLNYEAFFYGIFTVALFLKERWRRFAFVTGVMLCLSVSGAIFRPQGAAATMATSPMLMEFLLGMGISASLRGWAPKRALSLALFLIGGLALVAADIFFKPAEWRVLYFGLPASVLLVGLLGLESAWRRQPFVPLLRLGDASYSLYLCHPFVLSFVAMVVNRLGPLAGAEDAVMLKAFLFAGGGLLGSCAVAALSFRWIEKAFAEILVGFLPARGLTPPRSSRPSTSCSEIKKCPKAPT